MTKTTERMRAWCAVLVIAGIGLGCSTSGRNAAASKNGALSTSNGLWQNGLTTNGLWQNGLWQNGLWQNGLWQNGLWQNGLWQNGLWQNGLWQNGLWQNGLWQNGLWQNGLWQNGLWQNGLWQNGLSGTAALPGNTLRNSPDLRQLLQYIYSCAMPGPTYDADGATVTSYATSIDPNAKVDGTGSLPCSPAGDAGANGSTSCDVGYTCSPQGTCVISLEGAIGVGINADGTSWGASGKCDESCQRWVSACVLARTNAYGVHVEISMRAPADAPEAIKDALELANGEGSSCPAGSEADPSCGYTLREGAYYGNIFATTPVTPAPSPTVSPDGGIVPYSGPAAGPIANTPSYYACAGPESNIPEITKRFCSSQGDQSVIRVPGVCLTTASEAGTCASEGPSGTMQDCYTSAATQPRGQCADDRDPNCYNEVITVYLKQPIAVCGNGVCEDDGSLTSPETAASCPSDCHPGTWAKDYAQSSPNLYSTNPFYLNFDSMSAVAPDDTVVVAGAQWADLDLGGGTLPVSEGWGVLAKYRSDGSYAWGVRFGNASTSAFGMVAQSFGGQLLNVFDVKVASNGNITVVAGGVKDIGSAQCETIWIFTFTADGVPVGTFGLPIGCDGSVVLNQLQESALDSQGNIVLAGSYLGTATFGSKSFTSAVPITSDGFPHTTNYNYFIGFNYGEAYAMDTFLAKISPQGAVVWAQSLGGSDNDLPESMAIDPADNILLTTISGRSSTTIGVATLQKLSPDGAAVWSTSLAPSGLYLGVVADKVGNIYATGAFGNGEDFGGGAITSITGIVPFLVKYGSDGSFQWVSYANTVCPADRPNCGDSWGPNPTAAIVGEFIGFDPAGDPVILSSGHSAIGGGGIDFGVGEFPTYSGDNTFLSAYSPDDGRLRWAKQIPLVPGIDQPLGFALDSQGRVVLSGDYAGSIQTDDRLLVTAAPEGGTQDAFLASFSAPSLADTTPPAIGAATDQTGSPILTVPQPIFAQATSAAGATVFFMPPTATDSGNAGTNVSCLPAPNTTFPIGTTPVTCTASDPVGNHSTASFTVTVVDTLGPIISSVTDITVAATGANGATVSYAAPSAVDQVAGSRPVGCTPVSGSLFPVGTTKVTCTSIDNSGNRSSTTSSVTVTPPPPAVSVTCLGTAGAPVLVSTTPGMCGAPVSAGLAGSCAAGTAALASCTLDGVATETLGPGVHPVALVATGLDGSTASCTSYVRVADGEKPVVTCSKQTVACTGNGGATVTPAAACTDNCSCTASCTAARFPVGVSSGSCTATDPAGNSAGCQSAITVVDSVPPVVTPRSGPTQLQCNVDKWSDPGATALDQCVGDVSGSVRVSGAVDPTHVGTYVETYSASDPSGNLGSATRSVKVVDSVPPATTATAGPNGTPNRLVTIAVTSYTVTPTGGGTPITGSATCWSTVGVALSLKATDACSLKQLTYSLSGAQSGGATVSGVSASFAVTHAGTTTVSYHATDSAGNAEVSKTLLVHVASLLGFGISCAPSPSIKGLPVHGTVSVKGTVTITDSRTLEQTSQPFSFAFSY